MRKLTAKQIHTYIADVETEMGALRLVATEILRRGELPARDGFPSGGSGGSGSGISDPTPATALMPPMVDDTGRKIDRMVQLVVEIELRCRVVRSLREQIMSVADEERGRVSSVRSCECCEKPILGWERRVSGLCTEGVNCYAAWMHAKAEAATRGDTANRERFNRDRRNELAAHRESA